MLHQKLQLDTDETILFRVRKHWFILAIEILGIIIVALIPLLFFKVVMPLLPLATANISYTGYLLASYTAWLIILWISFFNIWTNYYLDVWTLTNKRLIAVDQHGLFRRTTASFRLERMQDVTISVNGILATFLKFGMLEIQTAGEERNFKVRGLPDPEQLKLAILDAAGKVSEPQNQNASGGM